MPRRSLSLLFFSFSLAALGCGDDGGAPGDSGTGSDTSITTDSGTPPGDTGTPPGDTGTPPGDTGTPPSDTGTPPSDTGTPPGDGGGGDGSVGSACGSDGDCDAGLTCLMTIGGGGFGIDFPGGYCTQMDCSGMGGSMCPAGSDCVSAGFGMFGYSYCAQSCSGMGDCRMGYECGRPPVGMVSGDVCIPTFGFSGDGGFLGDAAIPFP